MNEVIIRKRFKLKPHTLGLVRIIFLCGLVALQAFNSIESSSESSMVTERVSGVRNKSMQTLWTNLFVIVLQ